MCIILLMTMPAWSQLKIATGNSKGTYSIMFKEINQRCTEKTSLIEVLTSGSVENLGNLLGNKVNAAFIQTDVLHSRNKTEDLSNIQTLIALHPEEVHIVSLATSLTKEGGFAGVLTHPIPVNTIKDLKSRRVGASGGSIVTAQVIRIQSEIDYQVVEYGSNELLIKALTNGEIEAAFIVGGAPMAVISALSSQYKLLPIPDDVIGRLRGIYRPIKISYLNISNTSISTVATDALLVTRRYKTEKTVSDLLLLKQCILVNLDQLKETTGTHPKWQTVDPTNTGKWGNYPYPGSSEQKK
jgi:uncharacterized protein